MHTYVTEKKRTKLNEKKIILSNNLYFKDNINQMWWWKTFFFRKHDTVFVKTHVWPEETVQGRYCWGPCWNHSENQTALLALTDAAEIPGELHRACLVHHHPWFLVELAAGLVASPAVAFVEWNNCQLASSNKVWGNYNFLKRLHKSFIAFLVPVSVRL